MVCINIYEFIDNITLSGGVIEVLSGQMKKKTNANQN